MPYEVQTWEDLPSAATPIIAARLDHIEEGIRAATQAIEDHIAAVSSAHGIPDIPELLDTVNNLAAQLAVAMASLANVTVNKVWDSGTSSYVWAGGVDADPSAYGLIDYIGSGDDPATATGGAGDDYTGWEEAS